MKKIDRYVRSAVANQVNATFNNTTICVYEHGGYKTLQVELHGNLIFIYHFGLKQAAFTLAGWDTMLTRRRLTDALGIPLRRVRGLLTYPQNPECPESKNLSFTSQEWVTIKYSIATPRAGSIVRIGPVPRWEVRP